MCKQIFDDIKYKGLTFPLYTDPLKQYWTEKNPPPPQGCPNTGNYRGYYSTWEIEDNILYLTDIKYLSPTGYKGIDYAFPGETDRIKATWYTGDLEVYRENQIEEFFSQFLLLLRPEWIISIKNGNYSGQSFKLISENKLSNSDIQVQKPNRKLFERLFNRNQQLHIEDTSVW